MSDLGLALLGFITDTNYLRRGVDATSLEYLALLEGHARAHGIGLAAKARCDYIFSCGCRCQLDQHDDERHER